jgi:hypothetical protein
MDQIFGHALVLGLIGAIWHYLHTGKAPESAKDVFHPQNGGKDTFGNPDRDDFISYARDAEAEYRGLGAAAHLQFGKAARFLAGKANPAIQALVELARNEDWRGDEITNPHDPLAQRLQQYGHYFRDEFTPISMTKQQRGLAGQLSPVRPALREAVRTDLQNALLAAGHEHAGARTPEQVSRGDSLRAAHEAAPTSSDTRLVQLFRRQSPADREYFYGLANDHERALLRPYVAAHQKAYKR